MVKKVVILLFLCAPRLLFAQMGIGTLSPDLSAALEIKSDSAGLLIPRVALQSLNDQQTVSAPANSLLVFNSGTPSLSSGFYYWSAPDGRWHRFLIDIDKADLWQIQGQPFSGNLDSLYRMGPVAIGKSTNFLASKGVMLDVAGAIRGGAPHMAASVGKNSIAVGEGVKATKPGTVAFGNNTAASGNYALAAGFETEATHPYSVALGFKTKARGSGAVAAGIETLAEGAYAVALGYKTKAMGNYSLAFGREVTAQADYEIAFGRFNALLPTNNNATAPLFVIGNGTSNTNRSNAVTVLKNGWMGLGFTAPTGAANERLAIDGSLMVTNNTFPDYVFQHYFESASTTVVDYTFKSLEEVADFIRQFHHLPGIQPATALARTADGDYIINLNNLTIKSLEKIEELFLYTLEQEEKINALKEKVNGLKQDNQQLHKRLSTIQATLKKQNEAIKTLQKTITRLKPMPPNDYK